MDGSTGSWVALTAFTALLLGGYLIDKTDRDSPLEQVGALILIVGAGCSVAMIFQGFHLWNLGWEGISIEPEAAGRAAAKARGRGGIILLIIQFLPQFLVFGYGWMVWEARDKIRYSAKKLGIRF